MEAILRSHQLLRGGICAISAAVAGVLLRDAVPSAWRMPRSTSRTAGLAVGGSNPGARCMWAMAAARRVMVDARRPFSASAAR